MCGEKIWLYLLTFFAFLLYTCSIFCSLTYSTLSLNTTYLSFSPMEAIRLKYVLPSLSAAMLHIEICSCWRDINFSPLQGISCCCFASSFLSMRKVRCADMYIDMQCSFCKITKVKCQESGSKKFEGKWFFASITMHLWRLI